MTDLKAHAADNAHAADTPDLARPAKPDFAPVIRSKVQPPALRADTLTRERLIDQLDDSVSSRVVLVVADAGYGKTTLLADYAARSGFRTLWYRLGPSDSDSVTWANYLVAACREIDPSFGFVTTNLLANTPAGRLPPSAYIESFLGELGRWHDAPTVLVLDDYHEIDNNLEVADIVGRLIEDGPSWLHVVISARRRPKLAFGKLAAAAELSELRTEDLRFSPIETERLFAEGYSQPLTADVIQQLDRRTRGWAASLQLFHSSIRGRAPDEIGRLADSLSGASGPLYDYLAEEVLANLSLDVEDLLVRASLLQNVTVDGCLGLFPDGDASPPRARIGTSIDEAMRLGLLNRASQSSEASQLHPLLKDFLLRQLRTRFSSDRIELMHCSVADALRSSDELTAANHYLEAGRRSLAMECLSSSILTTIGSGKWGVAADLLERLSGVPGDPTIAAIRARQLINDGDPAAAERLLADLDLARCHPKLRAVIRQTRLSLGWRIANQSMVLQTLTELQQDPETPPILQDIARMFVDGGSIAGPPAALPTLAARLVAMAEGQLEAGHTFYGAISFHNASVAFINSGDHISALSAGLSALQAFELLGFGASERASAHAVVATFLYDMGRDEEGSAHAAAAIDDHELADVAAELSLLHTFIGSSSRAAEFATHADDLHAIGRSDVAGVSLNEAAKALAELPLNPDSAIDRLSTQTFDWALDLGHSFQRLAIVAQAQLVRGDVDEALAIIRPGIQESRRRGAKRSVARLAVLEAIALRNGPDFGAALAEAAALGQLILPELADAICGTDLLRSDDPTLRIAIPRHPRRWLPALRRQLGKGAPMGNAAAELLNEFGEFEDIGRLRAYAKTYRRKGAAQTLGLPLARTTSPKLHVRDLGRVVITVGDRTVPLGDMRRKSAALLMYLITRPSFNANREQVLDELWPESDPNSASNSLNQSLYFLRRVIDPWYEDGVSVDYVQFGGELVWLDPSLVSSESSQFLNEASDLRTGRSPSESALEVIRRYAGHFAPEFEYEEWASGWRTRLHATLLEVSQAAIDRLIKAGRFSEARDVAIALLEVDGTAADIERQLVWLQWHLGARSASRAQFQHLERVEQDDGGLVTTFEELVGAPAPH